MLDMSDESSTHANLGLRQSKWEFHIPLSTLFVMLDVYFTFRTVFLNKSQIYQHIGIFKVSPHICSRRGAAGGRYLCTTSEQLAGGAN